MSVVFRINPTTTIFIVNNFNEVDNTVTATCDSDVTSTPPIITTITFTWVRLRLSFNSYCAARELRFEFVDSTCYIVKTHLHTVNALNTNQPTTRVFRVVSPDDLLIVLNRSNIVVKAHLKKKMTTCSINSCWTRNINIVSFFTHRTGAVGPTGVTRSKPSVTGHYFIP